MAQMTVGPSQRIRLRRKTTANPQVVQQNIENLKKRSAKKLVAQALYYGTEGKSPLARDVLEDEGYKPPVHQRLGLKRQRRVPILGTNTAFIGPKKPDFRKIATNRTFKQGGPNYKYQKMTKLYTAQNRIQRIRNGMNNQNLVPQTQRIRLRRAISVPRNYTVQVQNTPTDFNSFKHSLKKAMNQRLQNEIKLIQSQHGRTELISFDEPLLVNCTTKTLNQRFSLLP